MINLYEKYKALQYQDMPALNRPTAQSKGTCRSEAILQFCFYPGSATSFNVRERHPLTFC